MGEFQVSAGTFLVSAPLTELLENRVHDRRGVACMRLPFRKIPRCRRPLIKGAIHKLELFAPLRAYPNTLICRF